MSLKDEVMHQWAENYKAAMGGGVTVHARAPYLPHEFRNWSAPTPPSMNSYLTDADLAAIVKAAREVIANPLHGEACLETAILQLQYTRQEQRRRLAIKAEKKAKEAAEGAAEELE